MTSGPAHKISYLGPCTHLTPLRPRQFLDHAQAPPSSTGFERAGPRAKLFFDPQRTRAGVVTCGGLCPGINDALKALVRTLTLDYGLDEVIGFRYGYRGLADPQRYPPERLNHQRVHGIHEQGGTILGSSRGAQDVVQMVDQICAHKLDMMFCVGGDGTLTGAHALHVEIARRGLPICVVGIPKTIDNDLGHVGRSFGFETAVYKTADIVRTAYWEAKGAHRGIGLVKLMGRDSGYIAAYAALATPFVDICLIPEQPLVLEGPQGLFHALERRFQRAPWAVIIVAEGAGQDLFSQELGTDASGNQKKHDIGVHLRDAITDHFAQQGAPVKVRYIDPSYLIRGVPAQGTDAIYCAQLAEHAAHAAMAGRSDMVVGSQGRAFTHVPLTLATQARQRLDPQGELWHAVLSATRQEEYFE